MSIIRFSTGKKRQTLPFSSTTTTKYNQWFLQKQKKKRQTLTLDTTFYNNSTIPVNPQRATFSQFNYFDSTQELKKPSTASSFGHRRQRTYSVFRNTQCRLSSLRQDTQQITRQVKQLMQKTKRSKLQVALISKQLTTQLDDRKYELDKELCALNKLVDVTRKQHLVRTDNLKASVCRIHQGHNQIKEQIAEIHNKLYNIQVQCGFIGLSHKLHC